MENGKAMKNTVWPKSYCFNQEEEVKQGEETKKKKLNAITFERIRTWNFTN